MQPVSPSPADALRFERICQELIRAGKPASESFSGIGTLGEKMLHAAVKTYLCEDTAYHEQSLSPSTRMVADVCRDGHIYEVQTGSFFPLRKKIGWYLQNTDYRITVVHPIPTVRYLAWINPESGDIGPRRRCPKVDPVKAVARQLYWLSDYIGDPRFSIRVLCIEAEEYRMQDGWGNGGKRGSHRYDLAPLKLLGEIELSTAEDYATHFLPTDKLPIPFTAAGYAAATGIRGRPTYGLIHLMERLELLEAAEKIGRGQGYRIR